MIDGKTTDFRWRNLILEISIMLWLNQVKHRRRHIFYVFERQLYKEQPLPWILSLF